MSAALKLATVASGFTIFSFSAFYSMRNSQRDFSQSALALEHTFEQPKAAPMIKPKLPSHFPSVAIGGYELRSAA